MADAARRYTLLFVWALALAGATLSGLAILQTSVVLLMQGQFFWEPIPTYFLWARFDAIGIGWPVFAFVEAVIVMALCWPQPSRNRRNHALLRILLWIFSGLIAALAGIGLIRGGSGISSMMRPDGQAPKGPVPWLWFEAPCVEFLWWGLIIALYLLLLYLGVAFRAHGRHAGRGVWRAPDRISVDTTAALVRSADFSVGEWQREMYIDMLTDAARCVERIKETVEPYTRSTAVRTRYSMNFGPHDAPDEIVVPLFATTRGQLEDGLRVSRPDGTAVSTFPHTDAVAYTAAVIRSSVRAAGWRALRAYTADEHSLERRVIGFLSRTQALDDWGPEARRLDLLSFARLSRDILGLPSRREPRLYRAVLLLTALYQSYPIVVSLSRDDLRTSMRGLTTSLLVERRTTPSMSGSTWAQLLLGSLTGFWRHPIRRFRRLWHNVRVKVMDQLRHLLGVRSNRLAHSLANAARARSYHLEFSGPRDTFMARQSIETLKGWDDDGERLLERIQALATPAVGQRHSHLYVRDGGKYLSRFILSVAYFERTPGSMAIAFVAAASSLLLSVIIAARELVAVPPSSPGTGEPSSLFEILFAFPIVAAAAGAIRPGRSQWGGVMAARVANGITIVVSLVALWISYVGFGIQDEARPRLWLGIIAVLVILTIACFGSWMLRLAVHSRFLYDPDSEDQSTIAGAFSPIRRPRHRRRAEPPQGSADPKVHARRMKEHMRLMQEALAEVRLGPALWVVPELWESKPWALPAQFDISSLNWDELKAAMNLGILTIDTMTSEMQEIYLERADEPMRRGTARRVLEKVVQALE